jgi:hypothetical protein
MCRFSTDKFTAVLTLATLEGGGGGSVGVVGVECWLGVRSDILQ